MAAPSPTAVPGSGLIRETATGKASPSLSPSPSPSPNALPGAGPSVPFPSEPPSLASSGIASSSHHHLSSDTPARDLSRRASPVGSNPPLLSSASRTVSAATSAIHATGSSFSRLAQSEADAKGSTEQPKTITSTQSLRAHQEEIDASPQGRLRTAHGRSQSIGPKSKVVMLQAGHATAGSGNPVRVRPDARRSMSLRPSASPSFATQRTGLGPDAEHARLSADERAREEQRQKNSAAKLAEQEAWEKTRGAGSDVLDLLDPTKRPEYRSSDSGDSGNGDTSAGTSSRKSSSASSPATSDVSNGRAAYRSKRRAVNLAWDVSDVLPSVDELQSRKHEPVITASADKLLSRGISEYTLLPRILGKGKFSSVFLASKPSGPGGAQQLFAVKHTPLFPHHPLIATRLLREPTLLAELPPHPNLVSVVETIRTPGHFYLVEEYLEGYVTLEALLTMRTEKQPPHLPVLPTEIANRVLDQLLSAVQAIHHPLQICHRDIKPENILVHPDSLQLKLLDFGLATHYSKSEPKLTTCCGSPAFHCPEIVTALRNPQGSIRYWGPEVDAWTCGITMLRVLTGVRYPVGASHTSVRSMASRAQRAVATIRDPQLRARVGKLLDANGDRRMKNFRELADAIEQEQGQVLRGRKDFKSTTFVPTTPQHTMKLPLVVGPAAEAALKHPLLPSGNTPTASRHTSPAASRASSPHPQGLGAAMTPEAFASPAPTLILSNRERQPAQRVLSFVKYCLRCAGILYHCWPDVSFSGGLSTPSTPGPWEAQLADLHERALLGIQSSSAATPTSALADHNAFQLGEDATPPPSSQSPTTPVPAFASRPERDPFVHVHVFECVIELVEEPSDDEASQPSLVQTIMNALTWGKRPVSRRTLSTPTRPDDSIRSSSRPRTGGPLRSPGHPSDASASGSGGPSGKSGEIECLRFYIIARFPRKASKRRTGNGRSASRTTELGYTRSRATSVASFDRKGRPYSRSNSLENLTHLNSGGIDRSESEGTVRASSRRLLPESNHTTPKASRTASPNTAIDRSTVQGERSGRSTQRARSALGRAAIESDIIGEGHGLTVETSPEVLRKTATISAAHSVTETASAPSSRPGSRAPSRSRASGRLRSVTASAYSSRSTSDKVLIHVTDERALAAVRKALSVGGTTEDFTPDVEVELTAEQPWMSPAARASELSLAEDLDEPATPQRGDQKRRRPASRRTLSYGGELQSRQRPHSVTSIDDLHGRRQPLRPADNGSKSHITAANADQAYNADTEQAARGRSRTFEHSNGAESQGHMPVREGSQALTPGVPFPSRRGRAPSQLSNVITQEESPSTASTLSTRPTQQGAAPYNHSSSAHLPEDVAANAGAGPFDLTAATNELASLTEQLERDRDQSPALVYRLTSKAKIYAGAMDRLRAQDSHELAQQLDSVSFEAFKALSPALGLVHADGRPCSPVDTVTSALSILGEQASPRELYMAIDLRCNALQQTDDFEILADGPGHDRTYWSAAAEVIGLMQLLSIVVPRIKTKRPQSFCSVFALLADLVGARVRRTADVSSVALARIVAHKLVQACCALIVAVAAWESRCNASGESPSGQAPRLSQDALGFFLAAVSNLMPYLPRNDEQGVAEVHFQRSQPRYAFARPGAAARSNDEQPVDDELVGATWTRLATTVEQLGVDLTSIWPSALQAMGSAGSAESSLDVASPRETDDATADRRLKSTLAVGGFVLQVQLLARHLGTGQPASWSATTAEDKLSHALPMLLLALGTEMERATSAPVDNGDKDGQRESILSDSSLLWLLWCIDALKRPDSRVTLNEPLVWAFSQALASHMPLSPSPIARHARLKALQDVLRLSADRDAAQRVLGRLIRESPFGQVRAACIGLLRSYWLEWISENREAAMHSIQSGRLLDDLFFEASEVDGLPAPAPNGDSSKLQAFLDDHAAVLREKAGLLYILGSSGPSQGLGPRLNAIDERWVANLYTWTQSWLVRFAADPEKEELMKGAEAEAQREVMLLRTALERLRK